MNPMNYLYFTLLSVFIQFCLMDIIMKETKMNNSIASNISVVGVDSKETLKTLRRKPHALYYRTGKFSISDKTNEKTKYQNSTIRSGPWPVTELMSTSFDLLYDENVSFANDDFTTESYLSTDFDNVTEITFTGDVSTAKPEMAKKTQIGDMCYCNLLYQVCDVNCCCDVDCSEKEQQIFKNFTLGKCDNIKKTSIWASTQNTCDTQTNSNAFEKLFCISKINLPPRKAVHLDKINESAITNHFRWRTNVINKKNNKNHYGEVVYMLTNGTFETIDLPIPTYNNFCNDNKPIRFLVNEEVHCYVRLKDIHMLQIVKRFQESKRMAVLDLVHNNVMNCSFLQCVDCTLLTCDEESCGAYSKEIHTPFCNTSYCTNIALKVEYNFYCNTTGLVNTTIKMSVFKVALKHEYVRQEINVRFYMTNSSDSIVQFSGNPGYLPGLPVIKSSAEINHTNNFLNASTNEMYKFIYLPDNKNGKCVRNYKTHKKMMFGQNKRLKCRLYWSKIKIINATDGCANIQNQITQFLGLNHEIYISPYGNPEHVKTDPNWILLRISDKDILYGEYHPQQSKLICFDIVTRFAFIMTYANTGDQSHTINKIMNATMYLSPQNVTFSVEESMSVVITIDINFVDASKPPEHVYAGVPKLNINLPKNFFLPFY